MGGRGAFSASGKPMAMRNRRELISRISDLDARIADIDAEASAHAASEASRSIEKYSFYSESDRAELERDEKAWFYADTDRAELARERSKLRRELEAIRAGQGALF